MFQDTNKKSSRFRWVEVLRPVILAVDGFPELEEQEGGDVQDVAMADQDWGLPTKAR